MLYKFIKKVGHENFGRFVDTGGESGVYKPFFV